MIHINPTTIDVALILGVISLITIAGRFIYRVTIFMDHLSTMLNAWDGKDGMPSVLDRLEDIEDKLRDVQYHVKPNHGGSSVDAQNRQLKEIISYLKEKNNG
jgi:putative holin